MLFKSNKLNVPNTVLVRTNILCLLALFNVLTTLLNVFPFGNIILS
jgi:hypothetical protein